MKVRVNNGAPIDPPKKQGGETELPKYNVNRDFSGEPTVNLSKTEAVTLDYAMKLLGGADYSNFLNTGYLGQHLVVLAELQDTNQLDSRIQLNSEGKIDQVLFDANNPMHQEHLYGNLATLIQMVRTEPEKKYRDIYMERLNENIAWIQDPAMRQNLTLQMATDPQSPTGKVVNLINTEDEVMGYYPDGADTNKTFTALGSHEKIRMLGLDSVKPGTQFIQYRQGDGYVDWEPNTPLTPEHKGYGTTGARNFWYNYDETSAHTSHNHYIKGDRAKEAGYPVEVHKVVPSRGSRPERTLYKPVRQRDFMDWVYSNGDYTPQALMTHLSQHGSLSMHGELSRPAMQYLGLPEETSYHRQFWSENKISPYVIYDRWMERENAMRLSWGKPIIPQKGLEPVPNPRLKTN